MGSAHITPQQKNAYLTLRNAGINMSQASKKVGFSYAWAKAFEKGLKNNDGASYRAIKEESKLPDPKMYNELSDNAKRGYDDFDFFRRHYLGHTSTKWQTETAIKIVDLLATPNKEYVVQNLCPGVGKTTMLHDVAAWATVRDRRIRGLFGSRAENNARRQLRRLRRTLERPTPPKARDELIALGLATDAIGCLAADYGTFKPLTNDIWKADEFIVAQYDDAPIEEKEPTWSCYGMDSAVLGNRFELIFWDDVVDRTTIRTMDAIENQREWWDTEGETRLEPNGVLFLVGQRMSPTDLYRYCLDKPLEAENDDETDEDKGKLYTHIIYRAHYDELCVGDVNHDRDSPSWPDGCLLDPYRVPWRGKGGVRALQQAKPRTWRIQYQQEDVEPDDTLVKDVWISGGIDPDDGTMCPGCWDENRDLCELPAGLAGPKLSVASVDPSGKKMWAIEWWVHAPASDQHFLMDLERRAMPANELLDWHSESSSFYGIMEDWQRRSVELGWPITHWIVEINAGQRYLLAYEHVKRWMSKWNVKIVPHTTGPRKLDADHGPWIMREHWRHGRIRLPGKQGVMCGARRQSFKLIDEVTRWPNASTTDDCVMAAWFQFIWLDRLTKASGPKASTLWTPPSWAKTG